MTDHDTVVSLVEYKRLEECTKNPQPPTQAALDGAELLRNLRGRVWWIKLEVSAT